MATNATTSNPAVKALRALSATKARRFRVKINCLATCLIGLLSLVGCFGNSQGGSSKPQLPVYSGATDIRVQVIPRSKTNDNTTEITTFLTGDKPDVVLQFYETELEKAGWISHGPATPVANKRYFLKQPGLWPVASSYGVVITATQRDDGFTHVELNMAEYLPQ
jgi:hypothetical protein